MPAGPRGASRSSRRASSGVDTVEFLGLPDGIIEYGLPLRATIAEVVRRHRPEIVITNNFRDTWAAGALNQADHIAVGAGRARRASATPATGGSSPTSSADGLEQWDGVRAVWAGGSPGARHAVDITETFDVGVESLGRTAPTSTGWAGTTSTSEELLEGFCRPTGAAARRRRTPRPSRSTR